MKRRINVSVIILAAAALAVAFGGCKLLKRPEAPPPSEQSFQEAAEKYFLDNGYRKIADGQYQLPAQGNEPARTEALEFAPVRMVKYGNAAYAWQGIVRRKTTTTIADKQEVRESPFIMYWNSKTGAWEHLFGSDIPQPGEQK